MPIDFPSSPTINDPYTFGGRTWIWNGTAWVTVSSFVAYGATGAIGATGATGAVGATGATGAIGATGSDAAVRIASTSVTGVAQFNSTYFTVSATGTVAFAAAYQATGSSVSSAPIPLATTTGITGLSWFDPANFAVGATGGVTITKIYGGSF